MNSRRFSFFTGLILLAGLVPVLLGYVSHRSVWPDGDIKVYLRLGDPPESLADGSASYDAVGFWVIEKWNLFMTRSKLVHEVAPEEAFHYFNQKNDVYFNSTIAGRSFNGALAVTYGYKPVGIYKEESDIIVNTAYDWDSYRGDLVNDVYDLRRVLFHEFGHLLGLGHPDEEFQEVEAVMNSTISDTAGLLEDDVRGMLYLYGGLGTKGGVGDSDDHGGLFTTATEVAVDSVTPGVLQDWDRDIFKITASREGALQVKTTGSTDTFGYLNYSTGAAMAFNDQSGEGDNLQLIIPASAGETFYVAVEAFYGGTEGQYDLDVKLLADPSNGDTASNAFKGSELIAPHGTLEGRLDYTFDVDTYRIDLAEPGRLSLAVNGDIMLSAALHDSTEEILEMEGFAWPTRRPSIQSELLEPGTYYFVVLSWLSFDIGDYTVDIDFDSFDPNAVAAAKLTNLSVRTGASGEFGPLVMGFVTAGAEKDLLLRAAGRSLAEFGINDHINDATLAWLGSDGEEIASNDDWLFSADYDRIVALGSDLGAFEFSSSLDSALIANPQPGAYTASVEDRDNQQGQVLVEVYDADSIDDAGRLVNLSTRSQVGLNDTFLTAGFVVAGEGTIRLLIRGVGPELATHGVHGVLEDPGLEVFNVGGEVIASNDDWGSAEGDLPALFTQLGAFALTPDSADASLVIEVEPGIYTVQLKGKAGQIGQGLIEIYEIPAE